MGKQCRALCEEATFPGQQVVVVASTLLMKHLVTGQSAIEDQHLGALLAWVDPTPGTDPVIESQERSLIPAASLLNKEIDDEVERLRHLVRWNDNGSEVERINKQIHALLKEGVRREWRLLEEARAAFWKLRLEPISRQLSARFISESQNRLQHFLSYGTTFPSLPHSLSLRLTTYEYAEALVEEQDACYDELVRRRMQVAGRALTFLVEGVDQPNEGRHPCTLTLMTEQTVLRIRPGTKLKSIDSRIMGQVVDLKESTETHRRRIGFLLSKGVRNDRSLVGQTLELVDTIPFDSRQVKRAIYKRMRQGESPLIYHNRLLPNVPRQLPPGSLLDLAEGARRR